MTRKKDHYGQSCLLFEWRGRAGAVYLCFPDKNCPKCHVYEYPTPGDTVFASLLTISANLNQEQKVPQICEQQSRAGPRWSPGHVINNNTALWACGHQRPDIGKIYRGWIWFIKIILLPHCTCPLHPIHPGSGSGSIFFGPSNTHSASHTCSCAYLPPRLLG